MGKEEAGQQVIVTLEFRTTKFSLFRDLPGRIIWEQTLQESGV